MENECLTELLLFIETTSQFYDFTKIISRNEILEIVRRYVSVLFQYPLLTESTHIDTTTCDCKHGDYGFRLVHRKDHYNLHRDLYITVHVCFQCGKQSMTTSIKLYQAVEMNSFLQLEYWVIRPFVLYKVRRQFEDSLFEYLRIQDLVELVGDYLYVEPPQKRNTQRKLIFIM